MTEFAVQPRYPVQLEVDYPEQQSRWKALLRIPLSIPLFIFLYLLNNTITFAIVAAILVRGSIPRWLFDFEVAFNRWQLRVVCYVLLLTDVYPPFEGDYSVRYDVEYPERLSRWRLLFWKLITSIPHMFVLSILIVTLLVVLPIGWFAILITGRFPQGLHGYVAGIFRWGARVGAYLSSLTDEFPPFSLTPDAGPGQASSYVVSSVIGVLAIGASIAGIVLVAIFARGEEIVTEVSYERLLAGEVRSGETLVVVDSVTVELSGAADPADELIPFYIAQPGYRFVLFNLVIGNARGRDLQISESDFRLKDTDGDGHAALLAVVGGRIPPLRFQPGSLVPTDLIFELPEDVDPAELRYEQGFSADTALYEFR